MSIRTKINSSQIKDNTIAISKGTSESGLKPNVIDTSMVKSTVSNTNNTLSANYYSKAELDTYIQNTTDALNKPAVSYSGDEGPYYVGGTYLFIINNWNGVAPVVSVSSGTVTVSGKYIYWTLGSDSSQLITVNGSASTINVLNDTRPRPNVDSVYKKFQIVGDGTTGRKITTGFDHVNDKVWTFIKSLADTAAAYFPGWVSCNFLPNEYTQLNGYPKNYTGNNTLNFPYRNNTDGSEKIVSKYFTDGFTYNFYGPNSTTRIANYLNDDYLIEIYKESPFFLVSQVYMGDGTTNRVIPHALGCKAGKVIIFDYDNGTNRTYYFNGFGNNIIPKLDTLGSQTSGLTRISKVTDKNIFLGTDTTLNMLNKKYVMVLMANDTHPDSIIKIDTINYVNNTNNTVTLGFEPQKVSTSCTTQHAGLETSYYSTLSYGGSVITGKKAMFDNLLEPGYNYSYRNTSVSSNNANYYLLTLNANGFNYPASSFSSQPMTYIAIRKGA